MVHHEESTGLNIAKKEKWVASPFHDTSDTRLIVKPSAICPYKATGRWSHSREQGMVFVLCPRFILVSFSFFCKVLSDTRFSMGGNGNTFPECEFEETNTDDQHKRMRESAHPISCMCALIPPTPYHEGKTKIQSSFEDKMLDTNTEKSQFSRFQSLNLDFGTDKEKIVSEDTHDCLWWDAVALTTHTGFIPQLALLQLQGFMAATVFFHHSDSHLTLFLYFLAKLWVSELAFNARTHQKH